ncbi:MAG TPA: helix-turn-helix domain-containing protein [Conexibacter sp.]|nr:helix-turn-helix domain-containing protein [Conexibacter sp.]
MRAATAAGDRPAERGRETSPHAGAARRGGGGASHRVAVLALPDVVLFDLAVPFQLLGRHYDVETCAPVPGPVPTTYGPPLLVERGLDALADADTILVPGFDPAVWPPPPQVLDALRDARARGARVASICTGAFALGAAGLLDGRRATTHWRYAARLAALHPRAQIDPDVLYVDDGDLLTSAGVAAGIDLCLHLLRRDHGVEAANAAARQTVVAPHRSGGQAQFIERAVPASDGDGLEATRAWALRHLDEPLTVAQLARHACCSERTLARRFRQETGTTPLRWLHAQRVDHARRLLEASVLPIEAVARRCGFGSAAILRQHFRRATATTPTAYRRTFGDDGHVATRRPLR